MEPWYKVQTKPIVTRATVLLNLVAKHPSTSLWARLGPNGVTVSFTWRPPFSKVTRHFIYMRFWVLNLRHLKGGRFSEARCSPPFENQAFLKCHKFGSQMFMYPKPLITCKNLGQSVYIYIVHVWERVHTLEK